VYLMGVTWLRQGAEMKAATRVGEFPASFGMRT
jgi:hypothetical protein